MTFERNSRFYAFGVSNGRKEHYRFYDGRRGYEKGRWRKRNIDSGMTIDFLGYLHRLYPKLLVIWDGAPNHASKAVKEYARRHGIQLLFFPTARPEDNPQEQAWDTLKSGTASAYYRDYDAYLDAVKRGAREKRLTKMFQYLSH